MPQMPSYPGKDYLDYQALEDLAISELKRSNPRIPFQVYINGTLINSIEEVEQIEPPYEFSIRAPQPFKPTSELFDAVKGTLESGFKSVDDLDALDEQLLKDPTERSINPDYQSLMFNASDFITSIIRKWQTKGGSQRMVAGSQEAIRNLRVQAMDSIRFTDADGDMNYFDQDKVERLVTSEHPYIEEDKFEELYANTPEESPLGIDMLHIHGLVENGIQYVYGYSLPQEVNQAVQVWEDPTYNNIRFKLNNRNLFRILLAYFIYGAPQTYHDDIDYVM